MLLAATEIDATSFLVIVAFAAVAGVVATAAAPGLVIPVVVVELLLGIAIGPQLLDIAKVDSFTTFFGNLGLGMLFFFAGYEIDLERIRGRPLELGVLGWLISLVVAYAISGALEAAGIVLSFLYTGTALATTAIGTLIPILRDEGEMRTRFGAFLLAAGAAGEFGPILLLTVVLSTTHPLEEALVLIAFVVLAVLVAASRCARCGAGGPHFSARSSRAASSPCASRWCWSSVSWRWPAIWGSTC